MVIFHSYVSHNQRVPMDCTVPMAFHHFLVENFYVHLEGTKNVIAKSS